MKHRALRIVLNWRKVSTDDLKKITRFLWERQRQDVDELVALFYLLGIQTVSTAYAIASCVKVGKANIRHKG